MAAQGLGGCELHDAMMGFGEPTITVSGTLPQELAYRKTREGHVILTGRVNGKADVDFILDTGAPVSVLFDGGQTSSLGLDTRNAKPLGDPDNPATPVGVIQRGLQVSFGAVTLSELTAAVIPEKSLPCRERFEQANAGGVIGASLFRRFVVEIDPVVMRVRLHDPTQWRLPDGAAVVPITFRNGHPFVDAKILLGNGREFAGEMNLDIGKARELSLVAGSHPAIVMPAEGQASRSCYVNGIRDERVGSPVEVAIGKLRIPVEKPLYSATPNAVDSRSSGSLGIGLFQGKRLTIDYPGRRLIVG
jgi:hypothetical protein